MNLSALVVSWVDIHIWALISLSLGRAGWNLTIHIVSISPVCLVLIEVLVVCYRNTIGIPIEVVFPSNFIASGAVSPFVSLVGFFIGFGVVGAILYVMVRFQTSQAQVLTLCLLVKVVGKPRLILIFWRGSRGFLFASWCLYLWVLFGLLVF